MTSLLLCAAVQQKLPLSGTSVAIVASQSSAKGYIPESQFTVMAFLLVRGPLCQTSSENGGEVGSIVPGLGEGLSGRLGSKY